MVRLCGSLLLIAFSLSSNAQSLSKLWNTILLLQEDGDYELSIHKIDDLLISYEDSGTKPDSLYALAIHKIGVALYYLEEEKVAIEKWKKSIIIRKELFPPDHIDIIKGLRNIATSYQNLNQLYLAKQAYQESLNLHLQRTNRDEELLARTYAELGYVYTQLKDFGIAQDYLKTAEVKYEHLFEEEPWELGLLYEYIYEYHALQEDTKQMDRYAQKSIDLYTSMDELYDEDFIGLANAYNNKGIVYDIVGDHSQAIENYLASLDINLSLYDEDAIELADNYTNLAVAYNASANYTSAIEYIAKAIRISSGSEDRIRWSSDLENLAEIYINLNQYVEANRTLTIADSILIPQIDLIPSLSLQGIKLKLIAQQGDYLKNSEKEKEALALIDTMMHQLQTIRETYKSASSKISQSTQYKPFISEGIEILFKLYMQHPNRNELALRAFQLSEQSKALVLLEAIADARAAAEVSIPDSIKQHRSNTRNQILQIEKALYINPDDVSNQETLLLARRDLNAIEAHIKSSYPDIESIIEDYTDLSLSEIISQLRDQNIVSYHLAESLFYFIISKDGFHFNAIDNIKGLDDNITSLRKGITYSMVNNLTSDQEVDAYMDTMIHSATAIYKMIVDPLIPHVNTQRLIIIPDEMLNYIPFEVLISRSAEESYQLDQHQYLIQDYLISYGYSVHMWYEMNTAEVNPSKSMLAIAPSYNGELSADRSSTLNQLKYNLPEAQAVSSLFNSRLLKGGEASKQNFIKEAPDYRIIHLASHGKANDLKGDFSYLAFSQVPHGEQILYNKELYQMRLNADLVTLSACETGIGQLHKGEGIISLSRGFSQAGTKSIITSLWSINDAKTKEIMSNLYSYIDQGLLKDEALRNAKLDFIKENGMNAHPFYWAAFIGIGDMEPILQDTSALYLMTGLIAVCLFIFLINLYRNGYSFFSSRNV